MCFSNLKPIPLGLLLLLEQSFSASIIIVALQFSSSSEDVMAALTSWQAGAVKFEKNSRRNKLATTESDSTVFPSYIIIFSWVDLLRLTLILWLKLICLFTFVFHCFLTNAFLFIVSNLILFKMLPNIFCLGFLFGVLLKIRPYINSFS